MVGVRSGGARLAVRGGRGGGGQRLCGGRARTGGGGKHSSRQGVVCIALDVRSGRFIRVLPALGHAPGRSAGGGLGVISVVETSSTVVRAPRLTRKFSGN